MSDTLLCIWYNDIFLSLDGLWLDDFCRKLLLKMYPHIGHTRMALANGWGFHFDCLVYIVFTYLYVDSTDRRDVDNGLLAL